mmetsp:Transcript_119211/g.337975  ORF Transcript_119211/g.337975 Transcript_119211/m.337975 type:complete len:239 (-) Transcript_119211:355-1071(-)
MVPLLILASLLQAAPAHGQAQTQDSRGDEDGIVWVSNEGTRPIWVRVATGSEAVVDWEWEARSFPDFKLVYPGDRDPFEVEGAAPFVTVLDPEGPDRRYHVPANRWNAPGDAKVLRFYETDEGYGKFGVVKACMPRDIESDLQKRCFSEFAVALPKFARSCSFPSSPLHAEFGCALHRLHEAKVDKLPTPYCRDLCEFMFFTANGCKSMAHAAGQRHRSRLAMAVRGVLAQNGDMCSR